MAIKLSSGKKQPYGRTSAFLGGIICLALSGLGFYAAFGSGTIDGGILLLPDSVNTMIGRILFGAGALFTGGLALYAFYECFWSGKAEKS